MLLPACLFALVQSFLALVEAQRQISLDTIVDLDTTELPNPPTFAFPSNNDPLYVSVALCSNADSPPRFIVTNDTTITQPGVGDVDNISTFEVDLGSEGYGSVMGTFTAGGMLSVVKGSSTTSFEMIVSTKNATADTSYPLLGDTTSNQALLFSPAFSPQGIVQPSYPNYTLPSANLTQPTQPSDPTNYTLVFTKTGSSAFASVSRSACAIRAAANSSTDNSITLLTNDQSDGLWQRDTNGWRWQWFMGGLTPNTNYTAYTLQTGMVTASKPINFVTKSASFNCPLVHNLPFCPSVSYAIPLTPPRAPATIHTADTIPPDLEETITSYMANFTTTLTTLACGRDEYSPFVTCADCQQAYRNWLCVVSFPRCGESPPNAANTTTDAQGTQAQVPVVALQTVEAQAKPRNPALPKFASAYQALLPCLETCNAADRACPTFLGFKCPLPQFTAANSYGVGYIDNGQDGVVGQGSTGVAQDVYGNVWCNAG